MNQNEIEICICRVVGFGAEHMSPTWQVFLWCVEGGFHSAMSGADF